MSFFSKTDKRSLTIAAVSLAVMPFLPRPLKAAVTLAASYRAFGRGARTMIKEKRITSEALEVAAIAVSLLRQNYGAANMTNLMVEISQAIENAVSRKSDELLLSLCASAPAQVWVKRDGVELLISAEEAKIGNVVVAYAGDTIAVDGTVLSGFGEINEASMTGEALPAPKERGSRVLSGTIMLNGRIEIYAEAVGYDRAVSRVESVIKEQISTRSATEYRLNRLADRLIPFTLALTGGTYLLTRDAARLEALLQADYSCALRLTVPAAFKAAIYQMGKRSLLVKSAEAIEKLARVDTFIFDKTGTITKGDFKVVDIISLDRQWSKESILSLAASIEEHYFHPIAQAIVEAARMEKMTHFAHGEVEFIAAHGVFAFVDGKKVVIGSRHYLEQDESIDFAPLRNHDGFEFENGSEGLTSLYIGIDGKLLGVVFLKDEARENAKQTIAALRDLGVKRFVMLTGDTSSKALALANELGFDECRFELKPDEKSAIVRDLKESGAVCAFVGDGINDAAAILFADVGIAMQKGADIAKASADISLLSDDISLLNTARSISLQANGRILVATKTLIVVNSAILFSAAVGVISGAATGLLHNFATITALSIASFRDFRPIKSAEF